MPRGNPHPPQPPVQLPSGIDHGGLTAYQHYGCRCRPCQERRRSYDRDYWERSRAGTFHDRRKGPK